MAIHETPPTRAETVQQGADKIRETFVLTAHNVEIWLTEIRQVINTHGRAAIDAELGGADAAELVTLYAAFQAVLQSREVGKTVDDLPA